MATDKCCATLQIVKRYFVSTDLPAEMADPLYLTPARPLAQFCVGWNRHPHARQEMIANKPACDSETLASIAVVIHALCDRDGVAPPNWVLSAKAAEPRLLDGPSVNNKFGECVKEESPKVCFQHDVYFTSCMLDKGLAIAT